MCDTDDLPGAAASLLGKRTAELESTELNECVAGFIRRRGMFLRARDECGSPLYIIEQEVLSDRAKQFTTAFSKVLPDVRVYYALKSNNHPLVSRILVENGLGLDVSSGLELGVALDSGADDIVFSGPGKTREELAAAVKNRHRVTVLLDSFAELGSLQEAAASSRVSVRAGIRVMTRETGIWRKFGIPLSDLSRFLEKAEKCDRVQVRGLQFHVSWNLDPCGYVGFLRSLGAMLGALEDEHRAQIEFIDIGGGFWPPQGEWLQEAGTPEGRIRHAISSQPDTPLRHFKSAAVGIEQFASAIADAVRRHIFPHISCRICAEPGRWLCNDAMHLLMIVMDKKAKDLVITDAGTNAVGWEGFETDYFPVINLSRPDTAERECLVMGSLCTPHDIWGYAYHGDAIEPGDVLLIPNQGAYTYSLRQQFIKPLPKVVCVRTSGGEIDIESIE